MPSIYIFQDSHISPDGLHLVFYKGGQVHEMNAFAADNAISGGYGITAEEWEKRQAAKAEQPKEDEPKPKPVKPPIPKPTKAVYE